LWRTKLFNFIQRRETGARADPPLSDDDVFTTAAQGDENSTALSYKKSFTP